MKLYTEEQVRKAIEFSRDTHQEGRPYMERDEYDYSIDEVVDLLTPIELPSDEEIKGYINSIPYYGHCTPEYCEGIEDGIKWALDKIQGSNK